MNARRRAACLAVVAAMTVVPLVAAQRHPPRAQRVDPRTSSIRGRVTTADTGAPIRGAEVRLLSDGQYSRLTTTDGEGRFELRDLAAGKYGLSVSRTGFVTLQFGQRRPFQAPSLIDVAEGQVATANVPLMRAGAIYGRLLDPFGEPAAGVRVQVMRSRMVQGARRLERVGPGDQTDDTGAFRVYALPPGHYFVAASGGPIDAVKRDPPVFYPGTPSFADAQAIALGGGAEAAADFQMLSVRGARVSGVVTSSSGSPVAAMVNLRSDIVANIPNTGPGAAGLDLHADARPDGTFVVENVPPGQYTLVAMLPFAPGPAATPDAKPDPMFRIPESVTMPLTIAGDDVIGLSLATRSAGMLVGRFITDSGVVKPLPTGLRVSMNNGYAGGMRMSMAMGTREDFRLAGMAGPFRFDIEGVPEGWAVKAIIVNGEDVTDEPIDLAGETATLRIVMTDRVTSVGGSVQARERGDVEGLGVVVFADDAGKWTWPSRHVRAARTDAQGVFQVRGLPPDQRYLAVALDYLEDGEEQDVQFLERLRSRAQSITLAEGEQRSIQLEVMRR
jgi:hypothetical protein